MHGHPPAKLLPHKDRLLRLVADEPDLTLRQIGERLAVGAALDRLVFLDETSFTTKTMMPYGRQASGQPGPARTLENAHLHRRPSGRSDRCTLGDR